MFCSSIFSCICGKTFSKMRWYWSPAMSLFVPPISLSGAELDGLAHFFLKKLYFFLPPGCSSMSFQPFYVKICVRLLEWSNFTEGSHKLTCISKMIVVYLLAGCGVPNPWQGPVALTHCQFQVEWCFWQSLKVFSLSYHKLWTQASHDTCLPIFLLFLIGEGLLTHPLNIIGVEFLQGFLPYPRSL